MAALENYIAETWQEKAEDFGKPPKKWQNWPILYSGYGGDRDGCIREGGIFGDVADLEGSITKMFRAYYGAISDNITKGLPLPEGGWLGIVIEPSWEDCTTVLVTYKEAQLLRNDCKAWNFSWGTPDEMAEAMLEDYEEIKANLQKALSTGSAQRAYVVISVYKGIIQGDDGVHVTFSQEKAIELQAVADKEMGIVRDADGRYDSDNDVYCFETDVEQ